MDMVRASRLASLLQEQGRRTVGGRPLLWLCRSGASREAHNFAVMVLFVGATEVAKPATLQQFRDSSSCGVDCRQIHIGES